MIVFEGIKHSKVTNIFYKYKDGKLLKFCAYNGKCSKWESSDYNDDNGNSKNWVKATNDQIKTFRL